MSATDFTTPSFNEWYAANDFANMNDQQLSFAVPYLNYQSQMATNQMNYQAVAATNAANLMAVHSTNQANMAMNSANINFQRQENEIAREREDNAVQRRVADLVRSGLSKTLAAGSAASANAMQAPQYKFGMQAPQFQAAQFEAAKIDLDVAAMKNAFKANELKARELDQADARLRLDEKGFSLDLIKTMSDVEAQRIENLYTQARTELAQTQSMDIADRLSIELSESVFRASLYAAQIAQAGVDLEFSQKNLELLGQQIVNAVLEGENISASTREKLVSACIQELTLTYMNEHNSTPLSVLEGEANRKAQADIVADEIVSREGIASADRSSRESISYAERQQQKLEFLDKLNFEREENKKDRRSSIIRTIAGAAVAGLAARAGGASKAKYKHKD